MRRLTQTVIIAASVVSAACSDSRQQPDPISPPTSSTLAVPIIPPDGGEPTYYEYTTTLSGSGGLPGWENASESHSRTVRAIHRWSYGTGSWDIENEYPAAGHEFQGFIESADVDVAAAVKNHSSINPTSRSGASLYVSSQPPIDIEQGTGSSASIVAASIAFNKALVAPSNARRDAPTFTAAEIRASRADRVIPSEKGKLRELALLVRQFGAATTLAGGIMEFKKSDGTAEVRFQFDPSIGTVTRIARFEGGKLRMEIVRQYRHQQGVLALAFTESRNFDDTGKLVRRFAQNVSNIVMR